MVHGTWHDAGFRILRMDLYVLDCGNYFLIVMPFTFSSYYF